MPRRKSPGVTLFLFVCLIGAGWAAYKYLYVERVFASDEVEAPSSAKETEVRRAIEAAVSDDSCVLGLTNLAWRAQEFRWRVDVDVGDICRDRAKGIAQRVHDIVGAVTGGDQANVFVYAVGQEVARLVP
jgi:hypothetical protein